VQADIAALGHGVIVCDHDKGLAFPVTQFNEKLK
jgi:hypothetical protein